MYYTHSLEGALVELFCHIYSTVFMRFVGIQHPCNPTAFVTFGWNLLIGTKAIRERWTDQQAENTARGI